MFLVDYCVTFRSNKNYLKMKRISVFAAALILIVTACKNEKKEQKTDAVSNTVETQKFVVTPDSTSVKWTAYKTTDKKPVGGEFTVLNFENKEGATPQDALNNLSFSIPVSSLLTKEATRDAKLKASFFGAMLGTEFIKGTIKYNDSSCVASITMNGVTNDLPLDVKISNETQVSMMGTMDLKDWNALDALESLNKVCFDLHKGEDGISKTWEDVAIEVSTTLQKN